VRRAALLLAVLALPALAVPAAAAPARRSAPAARDWSRTVAATPEGGFRMGNPAAPVKLVEYGSLTCPHCAAFAREGEPALVARYVRTGKVSYEFRNYILNGTDIAASLLARCSGARGFFPMAASLYATRSQWIDPIARLPQGQREAIAALTVGQRLVRLAEVGGLLRIAARFGVPPARGRQCLSDQAAFDRLGSMEQAGQALGVTGTPTFFLNGRMLDVNEWAAVEPLIRQAVGG
jgi:protein-disulfide isomerase